jgi:hypothetical protein
MYASSCVKIGTKLDRAIDVIVAGGLLELGTPRIFLFPRREDCRMSNERQTSPEPSELPKSTQSSALRHMRTAALVASLVPLAQVAVAPITVSAQCSGANCPPEVPEPGALLLMAPAAAAWLLRMSRNKNRE